LKKLKDCPESGLLLELPEDGFCAVLAIGSSARIMMNAPNPVN